MSAIIQFLKNLFGAKPPAPPPVSAGDALLVQLALSLKSATDKLSIIINS